MAPRQHTFTLVPNPMGMQGLVSRAGSGPQSKPPMTSKQAQKLYRQATRQPRLSKAEQRRLEREEQERIRRELDKEKQAAKARSLREKKKAKEQHALEERKRKGLPLVDVRPSQDTIARFVRGNGMGRKRDCDGARCELPVVHEEAEEEDDDDDRSSTEIGEDEEELFDREGGTKPEKRRRLSESGPAHDKRHTDSVAAGTETPNDGAGDLERPSPVGSRVPSRSKSHSPRGAGGAVAACIPEPQSLKPPVTGADARPPGLGEPVPIPPCRQGTPAATSLAPEKAPSLGGPLRVSGSVLPVTTATPTDKPVLPPQPQPGTPRLAPPPLHRQSPSIPPAEHSAARKPLLEITNRSTVDKPAPAADGAPRFSSPYKPALAPPRPARPSHASPTFKQPRPATSVRQAQKPRFLPPYLRPAVAGQQSPSSPAGHAQPSRRSPPCEAMPAPPTSTQLFVMSYIDDILPSPSQEAREVQGCSPPAAVKPLAAPPQPLPAALAARQRLFVRQTAHVSAPMAPPPRPAAMKPAEPPIIPPVSTQDLLLSSQDLRELEEPTPSKVEARIRPPPFKKHPPRSSPLACTVAGQPIKSLNAQLSRKQSPLVTNGQHSQSGPAHTCGANPPSGRSPSSSCLQHLSQKEKEGTPRALPRPAPPEKPRYLTSSGEGVEFLLALERSLKTHEEEEGRRRQERLRAQQGMAGSAVEEPDRGRQDPEPCPNLADAQHTSSRQRRKQPHDAGDGHSAARDRTEAATEHRNSEQHPHAASQETDYGDLDLDPTDFDGLDCLLADLETAELDFF